MVGGTSVQKTIVSRLSTGIQKMYTHVFCMRLALFSYLFFFFFSFFSFPLYSVDPINQLKVLIAEDNMSYEDMVLLLSLIYNSYERSAALIDAQNIYHHHAAIMDLVGNYICTTRRNPSKEVLEVPQAPLIVSSAQECARCFNRYKVAANIYVQCTEYVIKNNGLKNDQIVCLVKEFRSQVKQIVLNTIKTYYDTIQFLYNEISHPFYTNSDSAHKDIQGNGFNGRHKGVMDSLITVLPFFAEKMFISIDEKYIGLNAALHTFSYRNSISYAHIWNSIEQQRAKLYSNAYRDIVLVATRKHPHILVHAQAFGEDGFVAESKHRKDLPAPIALTISL